MRSHLIAATLLSFLAGTSPMALADTASDTAALIEEGKTALRAKNFAVAVEKIQKAAEAGNAEAQGMFGQLYVTGNQGLEQNFEKALFWLNKGAEQGGGSALFNLGSMYRNGQGVAKDSAKAKEYFIAASAAGQMKASRYVGLSYEEAGDHVNAVKAYQLGADRGDITSQFYLGRAYELGQGIGQDYALALQWYTKSAERGDHVASDGMVGLAGLYERGLGVEKNSEKAIALYKEAAAVENENAKLALKKLGIN